MKPNIEPFFDPITATMSYVVYDDIGGRAAVVDSVLGFDPKSGRTSTASADKLLDFLAARGLKLDWILETHAPADHLSAARYVKRHAGGRIAIGERIRQVQGVFKKIFNLEPEFRLDGSQFDHLFADGEVFRIGRLEGRVLFVPGHTPADAAYQVGDAVFVGDTLFMPDVGTARCDFPGGNAHTLYRSVRRLLALPDETRLFVCHDYPPGSRAPRWETTVREQRLANIHVRDSIGEDQFVAMRTGRDATLDMPTLMLPSVQVNVRAGEMPPAEANGVGYLKIPVDSL